jgi:amino acid transporter
MLRIFAINIILNPNQNERRSSLKIITASIKVMNIITGVNTMIPLPKRIGIEIPSARASQGKNKQKNRIVRAIIYLDFIALSSYFLTAFSPPIT